MTKYFLTRAIADTAIAQRNDWQQDIEREISEAGLLGVSQVDIMYVFGMSDQIEKMQGDVADHDVADIIEMWVGEAGLLSVIGNELTEHQSNAPLLARNEGRLLALKLVLRKLVSSKQLSDKQRYRIQHTLDELNL